MFNAPTTDLAEDTLRGVLAAVHGVNVQGGIRGRRVTVVPYGDKYNASIAVSSFKRVCISLDEKLILQAKKRIS